MLSIMGYGQGSVWLTGPFLLTFCSIRATISVTALKRELREMTTMVESYPVSKTPRAPHGNTKTALPFHHMEVGESFIVPPEDYSRTNSARAHYTKKRMAIGKKVQFTSRQMKDDDGNVIGYQFRREK
jgi:hypothetical protein